MNPTRKTTQARPWRIGTVPYLNAVPLTWGLENQVTYAVPSRLSELLASRHLDAALLSTSEVLLSRRYRVIDGIAVAARGPVYSVILAAQKPIDTLTTIHCDPASRTSVALLKVLLAQKSAKAKCVWLENHLPLRALDAVLLIGNRAISFRRSRPPHQIWDLGEAWHTLTGLPFAFAVWAVRRQTDPAPLREILLSAKDRGLKALDVVVRSRGEFDPEFRRRYLTEHIRFDLGPQEKRGLFRFAELMRQYELGQPAIPEFV